MKSIKLDETYNRLVVFSTLITSNIYIVESMLLDIGSMSF